jgi:hypothetical protein
VEDVEDVQGREVETGWGEWPNDGGSGVGELVGQGKGKLVFQEEVLEAGELEGLHGSKSRGRLVGSPLLKNQLTRLR